MKTIDVGEGENAREGLVTLVVTVIELLIDALEREAVRRMEAESLTDEEIDRMGRQLAAIEDELEALKRDEGIEDSVDDLRGDLDGLFADAIERLDENPEAYRKPGYSVFGGEGE